MYRITFLLLHLKVTESPEFLQVNWHICCVVFASKSDRDLWWAVCQRGGPWPAVCPHSPRINCNSWITTRGRHTEQVRHKMSFYVCFKTLYRKMTPYFLGVTEGTASFLPIINKERHTRPHCQMWVSDPNHYVCSWSVTMLILSPLCDLSGQGLAGSWEAPLDFTSKERTWRDCN